MPETLASSLTNDFPELVLSDATQLVEAVRGGLPTGRFDALQRTLGVSSGALAGVLHISPSTLSRRRQRGTFDVVESERLVRLARLVARAVEVMEGVETARRWLTEPTRALGGETPLRYASVGPGAREVEHLLTRLEHGVYS